MVEHQTWAAQQHTMIIANLDSRSQDAGQEAGSATLSQENLPEQGLDQGKGLDQGAQLDSSGGGVNVDDDRARAWIDGVEIDSVGADRSSTGDAEARDKLEQYADRGDTKSEFRDAAHEVLDHHIDNGPTLTPDIEQQQPGIEIE